MTLRLASDPTTRVISHTVPRSARPRDLATLRDGLALLPTLRGLLVPLDSPRLQSLHLQLGEFDATAAFKRDGSDEAWGSGFYRLTEGTKRLAPGARVLVTMSSDARYALDGEPATAFTNPSFKSINTKFFLRVGSSPWVEFGAASVENVIGSKDARAVLKQPPS